MTPDQISIILTIVIILSFAGMFIALGAIIEAAMEDRRRRDRLERQEREIRLHDERPLGRIFDREEDGE